MVVRVRGQIALFKPEFHQNKPIFRSPFLGLDRPTDLRGLLRGFYAPTSGGFYAPPTRAILSSPRTERCCGFVWVCGERRWDDVEGDITPERQPLCSGRRSEELASVPSRAKLRICVKGDLAFGRLQPLKLAQIEKCRLLWNKSAF
uniref:Uncharacterized protein n=1 Tax=Knipowitschia caucasica TaxID=637954 RepID=A0AAV2JVC6_KNICA